MPPIESGDSGGRKPPPLTDSKDSETFRTDTKALIDHFLALDYSLIRIKTDWPTDHLALPNERADLLALCLQQQEYQTDLLSGSNVDLTFENDYFYAEFTMS